MPLDTPAKNGHAWSEESSILANHMASEETAAYLAVKVGEEPSQPTSPA